MIILAIFSIVLAACFITYQYDHRKGRLNRRAMRYYRRRLL